VFLGGCSHGYLKGEWGEWGEDGGEGDLFSCISLTDYSQNV
jgi:hypothetical protein